MIVNVEIQVVQIPHMPERILFYTSKMITEQINSGESYKVIKNVISIVITDYALIEDSDNYHNIYQLYDKNSGSTFTEKLEVNTLEIPKLPKETDKTELFNWMTFLKSEKKEEFEVISEVNPNIKKAYGVLKELSQDERTRLLFEEREKAKRDEIARLEGALDKGRAEGMAKGIVKGKIEGRAEGKAEGIEIVAVNLLKMGMDIENIAEATKLSFDDVNKIKEKLN